LTATNVTVTNQGAGPSAAFSTTIADSQNNVLTLGFGALAAGASQTVPYDCTKLLRSRLATADSAGVIAETNEANNTAEGVFACPLA
jgi:subtilase family serine protease